MLLTEFILMLNLAQIERIYRNKERLRLSATVWSVFQRKSRVNHVARGKELE